MKCTFQNANELEGGRSGKKWERGAKKIKNHQERSGKEVVKKCPLLIIFIIMQISLKWEEVHTSQHFL